MRTSGTTVIKTLQARQYVGLHNLKLKQQAKHKIKPEHTFVSGHIPYGVHKQFNFDPTDVDYITILRDPIDRLCSLLNKHKDTKLMKNVKTLRDNIEHIYHHKFFYHNQMMLQIAGIDPYSKKKYSSHRLHALLNTAKENILKYKIVLFCDDNGTDYEALSDFMNLSSGYFKSVKRHRKAHNHFHITKSDEGIRKTIRKICKYDIKFYKYCLGKFT